MQSACLANKRKPKRINSISMKNFLIVLFSILVSTSMLVSQSVPRDKVLVEIGTGTWCQYCPGSAMGADDLIANGHDVAIIENHNGDSYTTAASNARNAYYSISGYPTALFDGGSAYVGGSYTTSLYPQYLSRYNQKIAIPSYFSIDIEGTTSGYAEFNITVTIDMVDSYTSSDIRLHCVITESEIQESWQGQDHLNFVNRLMVPTHNGIQLDFSGGNVVEQEYNFELDPSWVPEHCELVIFLQDNTNKTVLNASKRELMEFENVNDYDAFISQLSNLPEESCLGMFEPKLKLKNNGNLDLTELTINYQVNDGDINTYNWTGSLAFLGYEIVTLPAINFTSGDDNQIKIYTENPNGTPDQYPKNDTIDHTIPGAGYTASSVSLYLKADDYPEEITWEMLDDEENFIHSGGPYTQPGELVLETFELESDKCYRFTVVDAGNNGLESPGMFRLYYGDNEVILQGLGDFGSVLSTDFHSDNTVGINDSDLNNELSVYPNPFSHQTNIRFTSNKVGGLKVKIYNLLGELVYENDHGLVSTGENEITLDGNTLENGIYLLQLEAGDQVISKKVTKTW